MQLCQFPIMSNVPTESWLNAGTSATNAVEIADDENDAIDYSSANKESLSLPLDKQPSTKQYSIKTEDTVCLVPISFGRDESGNIYRQIGVLLKLRELIFTNYYKNANYYKLLQVTNILL